MIVIIDKVNFPIQEYRYCNRAHARAGFRLLVRNDDGGYLGGQATYSTIDSLAGSSVLYHSTTRVDSPECNGLGENYGSSVVSVIDTRSRARRVFANDSGAISSAVLSPTGVAAWIVTNRPCSVMPSALTETLQAAFVKTAGVTTLDFADLGDTTAAPPALANVELYRCVAGCSPDTTIVTWTHSGTWRYARLTP